MNEVKCPFCAQEACEQPAATPLSQRYSCNNCGVFELHRDMRHIQWEKDKYIIAGYLFETNRESWRADGETKIIKTDIMDEIKRKIPLPITTMWRLEKLLLYLHSLNRPIGEEFFYDETPLSAAYAKDDIELIGIQNAMKELGWLANVYNEHNYKLTVAGLTHAEELLRTNIDSKQVFVAMAFQPDLLEVHEEAIKPACLACGFRAQISNDNEYNDGIMDEIITEIKRSKFVIVDFTYNNNGAYFEAGYAQGLGREIIRLCKRDWLEGHDEKGNKNRLHFDIQHYNIILWDNHADLLKKLKARIRATIPDAILED